MPDLIHGGKRTTWNAAIVCLSILLAGVAIMIDASFPSGKHGLFERAPVLSFPMKG